MFSDSFAGIAPASVPGFIVAELGGAALAVIANRIFNPTQARRSVAPIEGADTQRAPPHD
jgi:hypothetical protein